MLWYEFPALYYIHNKSLWVHVRTRVIDVLLVFGGVNNILQNHTYTLKSACFGCETGVWSSTVNHRFDFAYPEDAVTRANTTTLGLSLSSLSPPSPLYLSIIKVGIDPFTTLPLSACSHKAQTCQPSLNQWHLPALPALFLHLSFVYSLFHLVGAHGSFVHYCFAHLDSSEKEKRNNRLILIFHGMSKSDGH